MVAINKITLTDISDLQKIGRQTFQETFARSNTAADMQKYLADSFSTDKLTTELNDPNAAFYFATLDNKIVGYLKLNRESSQTELQDKNALEIERIYVLQQYHGKKIGFNEINDLKKQYPSDKSLAQFSDINKKEYLKEIFGD